MQVSDKSIEKRTIMDYLPQHERAKVRKLVQRLAQETQEKQKYKKLYDQLNEKYEELNKKYEELQEYSNDLKSQIATSKMAINKAKQAYIASKSAKKIRKLNLDQEVQNEQGMNIENLKQTWLKIPKSSQNPAESIKNEYIFEQNQNNLSKSNNNLNLNLTQKSYPTIPLPLKSDGSAIKKSSKKNLQDTTLHSSNKKQEIMNLRKEIESLTEQMKKKEVMGLPLNQKLKKCEEIKNRYLKSKQKRKRKVSESESDDEGQKEQIEEVEEKEVKKEIKKKQVITRRPQISSQSANSSQNTSNPRRNEPKQKFDQSLFAIIDQLNSGN